MMKVIGETKDKIDEDACDSDNSVAEGKVALSSRVTRPPQAFVSYCMDSPQRGSSSFTNDRLADRPTDRPTDRPKSLKRIRYRIDTVGWNKFLER